MRFYDNFWMCKDIRKRFVLFWIVVDGLGFEVDEEISDLLLVHRHGGRDVWRQTRNFVCDWIGENVRSHSKCTRAILTFQIRKRPNPYIAVENAHPYPYKTSPQPILL